MQFALRIYNAGAGLSYLHRFEIGYETFRQPFLEISGIEAKNFSNPLFLKLLRDAYSSEVLPATNANDFYLTIVDLLQGSLVEDPIHEKQLIKPQQSGTCASASLTIYYKSRFSENDDGERLVLDLQATTLENYFAANKNRIRSESLAANLAEKSLISYSLAVQDALHRQIIDYTALEKAEELIEKLSLDIPKYPFPLAANNDSITTAAEFIPKAPITLNLPNVEIDQQQWVLFADIKKDIHHLTQFADRLIQANNAGQYMNVLTVVQELALSLPLNIDLTEFSHDQLTGAIKAIGIISREHAKARGLSYASQPGLQAATYIAQVKLLAIVEKMAINVFPTITKIMGPAKPSALHSTWLRTKPVHNFAPLQNEKSAFAPPLFNRLWEDELNRLLANWDQYSAPTMLQHIPPI